MNGHVDGRGRALVSIPVRSGADSDAIEIEVWIDTGFTGELVLSHGLIATLALPQSAVATAELADGTSTTLDVYSRVIEWFGRSRPIEVLESAGDSNLLGVELLNGHTPTVDYQAKTLTID
jgi:clan AA aspartic protease